MGLVTKLPPGLNEHLSKITKGVTQWSRLVAWSWTDYLAFAGEPNEEQERKLKTLLIEILQQQAQHAEAFIAYGKVESESIADKLSIAIDNLMLGVGVSPLKISDLMIGGTKVINATTEGITLTLSDVIEKITGEKLVTTEFPEFIKLVSHQVLTNTFVGGFAEIPPNPPGEAPSEKKYFSYIAYPPRPEFDLVTDEKLRAWASNSVPGGSYLPPSPYIPTAVS
jgi:hypothetical protein